MKKLLATLLLLCLMLPACALGLELSRSGGSILTPIQNGTDGCYVYTLEAGQSYTMSGDLDDGVRLHLNKASGGSARAITLIMNGVDISSSSGDALAVFSNGVPLNIIPVPDKTNRVHSASVPGSGLLISGADVTVSGSGTLSASASGYSCHGLYAVDGSTLTVSGSGTLSVSASGYSGHGLYAVDNSTVNVSSGTLSASASDYSGYGLFASASTVNVSGGTLSASAYKADGYGMVVSSSTVNVSGGTLRAAAEESDSHGLFAMSSTLTVSGGELSVATKAMGSRSLYVDRSTANVTGGRLSVSAKGMKSTGVFAEHNAALNVTGGSMSVQAPGAGNYGLHLDASLLTVGAEGNFDAYGAESAFQPVSGRIVEVQGEGRDIYGRDSQGEDWAVYTYGKKYAKVLPEYSSPNALPKTGDPSMLSAWACVMLSALGALALMKMRRALR